MFFRAIYHSKCFKISKINAGIWVLKKITGNNNSPSTYHLTTKTHIPQSLKIQQKTPEKKSHKHTHGSLSTASQIRPVSPFTMTKHIVGQLREGMLCYVCVVCFCLEVFSNLSIYKIIITTTTTSTIITIKIIKKPNQASNGAIDRLGKGNDELRVDNDTGVPICAFRG